jgi:hypothetical protein
MPSPAMAAYLRDRLPDMATTNTPRRATPKDAIVPRVVAKRDRKLDLAAEERAARKAVDARDHHRCFFPRCRAYAGEKHHVTARSVRGKTIWRTDDLLSACSVHHGWFKAQLIRVKGNPDRGPVTVQLTVLGRKSGIRVPTQERTT